eukprot:360339-Chlamydomonas_euryale.AAC.12
MQAIKSCMDVCSASTSNGLVRRFERCSDHRKARIGAPMLPAFALSIKAWTSLLWRKVTSKCTLVVTVSLMQHDPKPLAVSCEHRHPRFGLLPASLQRHAQVVIHFRSSTLACVRHAHSYIGIRGPRQGPAPGQTEACHTPLQKTAL